MAFAFADHLMKAVLEKLFTRAQFETLLDSYCREKYQTSFADVDPLKISSESGYREFMLMREWLEKGRFEDKT